MAIHQIRQGSPHQSFPPYGSYHVQVHVYAHVNIRVIAIYTIIDI